MPDESDDLCKAFADPNKAEGVDGVNSNIEKEATVDIVVNEDLQPECESSSEDIRA